MLVLGATGSIGRAVVAELLATGHHIGCLIRAQSESAARQDPLLSKTTITVGQTDTAGVREALLAMAAVHPTGRQAPSTDRRAPAIISCIASRTGTPRDAWAVDYQANHDALTAAEATSASHFVLLSAICVQKPKLEFQRAKLAFERELIAAPIPHTIVRPTAFFKSLSGQVDRVKAGKRFLVFGDGHLTACKPMSDRDLATYLVGCLHDPTRHNTVRPIGGPGPALTPTDIAHTLFRLTNQPARIQRIPLSVVKAIAKTLNLAAHVAPQLAEKAELANIAHYYATESMLVWDEDKNAYDAAATPEFGQDTLQEHLRQLVDGARHHDSGAHRVF